MSLPPRFSPDEIQAHLAALSRAPFREFLTTLLGAAPTPEAVAEWAARSPDRYAQAVAIYGKLSGFSEKTEVDISITDYSRMSDAELLESIDRLDRQRAEETGGELNEDSDTSLATRTPQGSA